jgi:hypothetical protein
VDMVTTSAVKYVTLGHLLEGARMSFLLFEGGMEDDNEARIRELKNALKQLIKGCEELGLSRAQELVSHAYDDPPQSKREFELLLRAVMTDIQKTVFLLIPEHLINITRSSFLARSLRHFRSPQRSLFGQEMPLLSGRIPLRYFIRCARQRLVSACLAMSWR